MVFDIKKLSKIFAFFPPGDQEPYATPDPPWIYLRTQENNRTVNKISRLLFPCPLIIFFPFPVQKCGPEQAETKKCKNSSYTFFISGIPRGIFALREAVETFHDSQ